MNAPLMEVQLARWVSRFANTVLSGIPLPVASQVTEIALLTVVAMSLVGMVWGLYRLTISLLRVLGGCIRAGTGMAMVASCFLVLVLSIRGSRILGPVLEGWISTADLNQTLNGILNETLRFS